jgi:hypothetical protein
MKSGAKYQIVELPDEVSIVDTESNRPVISYPYEDNAELFHQTMNANRECARLNGGQP